MALSPDDLESRLANLTTQLIPIAYLKGGVTVTSGGDYKVTFIIPGEFDKEVLQVGRLIRGIPVSLTIERWENADVGVETTEGDN